MQSMSVSIKKQVRSPTLMSYIHKELDIRIIINGVLMFSFQIFGAFRDTSMGIQNNYFTTWNRNA